MKPYCAVKRDPVSGELRFWQHPIHSGTDQDEWVGRLEPCTHFDDEAIYRGGLPKDAEQVVLGADPTIVVLNLKK